MADDPKIQQPLPESSEPGPTGSGGAEQPIGGLRLRFKIAKKELRGLFGNEEWHRRLHGRLLGILTVSLLLDVVVSAVLFFFDSFSDKPDLNFGRAFAWTSSQMLVGGSSYTTQSWGGHIAEVLLQGYGVTVIAAIAGSFASFFLSRDT